MTSPYLLDTNVCIEIARGRLSGIQNHMAGKTGRYEPAKLVLPQLPNSGIVSATAGNPNRSG